jgi:hypothetical protein
MLLALTGIFLGVIGYFLKDLHRKFSVLVDKVNGLATDHSTETGQGRVHRENQEKTLTRLSERVDRLELHLIN